MVLCLYFSCRHIVLVCWLFLYYSSFICTLFFSLSHIISMLVIHFSAFILWPCIHAKSGLFFFCKQDIMLNRSVKEALSAEEKFFRSRPV